MAGRVHRAQAAGGVTDLLAAGEQPVGSERLPLLDERGAALVDSDWRAGRGAQRPRTAHVVGMDVGQEDRLRATDGRQPAGVLHVVGRGVDQDRLLLAEDPLVRPRAGHESGVRRQDDAQVGHASQASGTGRGCKAGGAFL